MNMVTINLQLLKAIEFQSWQTIKWEYLNNSASQDYDRLFNLLRNKF